VAFIVGYSFSHDTEACYSPAFPSMYTLVIVAKTAKGKEILRKRDPLAFPCIRDLMNTVLLIKPHCLCALSGDICAIIVYYGVGHICSSSLLEPRLVIDKKGPGAFSMQFVVHHGPCKHDLVTKSKHDLDWYMPPSCSPRACTRPILVNVHHQHSSAA